MDAASVKDALLVVPVPEVGKKLPSWLKDVDEILDGGLARAVSAGDFSGEKDQLLVLYPKTGPSRVILVGMGTDKRDPTERLRRAAAVASRQALKLKADSISFQVLAKACKGCKPQDVGQVLVEGAAQGSWTFEDLRSKPKRKSAVANITILAEKNSRKDLETGRKVGDALAAGHSLARRLQMFPGNHCTPAYLADVASELGRKHGLEVNVLRRSQLEKEKMNALLAVAQGSAEEPRLITLEYRGGGRAAPICLVGKGVTFDSGGISIKPALNMEEMKYDMSGAAAVLGTFEAIGRLKPKINVVGLVPATENLPSGTAIKPGDVVTTHLGKTVEIINTDAEGRLILCDALSYARRFKPNCILDVATLTGAVVIGLGHVNSGVMGNDEALVAEVRIAGRRAGEPCWQLPLSDEYRKQLDSDTADFKNVGGRPAGSITAGWFLREFVDDRTPWVHLDIAGTAWTDGHAGLAKGPTGVGVRLFSEFILDRAG